MKKNSIISIIVTTGTLIASHFLMSCLSKEKLDGAHRNPSNYASENKCEPLKYSFYDNSETPAVSSYTLPGYNTQSKRCEVEVPTGLANHDLADFHHLSEGADVYPYEWFMHLKSKVYADSKIFNENLKSVYQGYFHEFLDKKFGILKIETKNQNYTNMNSMRIVNGKPRAIQYMLPYSGLTVAWSNHPVDNKYADKTDDVSNYADAFSYYENSNSKVVREERVVKEVNEVMTEGGILKAINGGGIKSIRMVGTNCALCHSGAVQYKGKIIPVQGAPSMVNVRSFFKDMAGSTVFMLSHESSLKEFLANIKKSNPSQFHYINPEKDAKEISGDFTRNFAKATHSGQNNETIDKTLDFLIDKSPLGVTKAIATKLTLLKAKKGDNERLFKGVEAIKNALIALLKKTYNFSDEDLKKTHLINRMDYFAKLSVGIDPTTSETPSGYNRTDAFGRIGNLVLRGSHPVDITAPVSLPWVWGLKYMANLHYNGNSNSVIMRNVGQSLGLGAIILNSSLESTVNLYNLDRIEHLVHKIKVPEWNDIFKEEIKKYPKEMAIDVSLLEKGYQIYKKENCMHCHESNRFAGPSFVLRQYNMYPLSAADGKCKVEKNNQTYEYDCSPNTDNYAALNPIKPITDDTDPVLKKLIPFQDSIFNGVGAIKEKYYSIYGITKSQQKDMEFYNIRGNEFFRDTYNGFSEQDKHNNNYGNIVPKMGYKARHLSGVWATAPFLHNGSVPTLWELLKPSAERAKYFNVKSMNFDPQHIGAPFKDWNRNNKKCDNSDKIDKEICFDTTMAGNSNLGHEWGTKLKDDEKRALIEFLKYLPPEPEYSWSEAATY